MGKVNGSVDSSPTIDKMIDNTVQKVSYTNPYADRTYSLATNTPVSDYANFEGIGDIPLSEKEFITGRNAITSGWQRTMQNIPKATLEPTTKMRVGREIEVPVGKLFAANPQVDFGLGDKPTVQAWKKNRR